MCNAENILDEKKMLRNKKRSLRSWSEGEQIVGSFSESWAWKSFAILFQLHPKSSSFAYD